MNVRNIDEITFNISSNIILESYKNGFRYNQSVIKKGFINIERFIVYDFSDISSSFQFQTSFFNQSGDIEYFNQSIPLIIENEGNNILLRFNFSNINFTAGQVIILDPKISIDDVDSYDSIKNNITTEAYPLSHITLNDSSQTLYLPFDVNNTGIPNNITYDYSDYNNDGNVKAGGEFWNLSGGIIGGGYKFAGTTSQGIVVGTGSDFSNLCNNRTGGCAFGAWFKSQNFTSPNVQYLLARYDTTDSNGFFAIRKAANRRLSVILTINGSSDDCSASGAGGQEIIENKWQHVLGVYNMTSLTLYQDGVILTIDPCVITIDETLWQDSETTFIGIFDDSGPGSGWNGSIDEVMFFNRSLTAEDVRKIYKNQSYRFITPATQLFTNVNFTSGDNKVNVTTNSTLLFGANISLRLREITNGVNTSWQNISDGDNIVSVFNISTSTNNISLEFDFIPYNKNQSGNFYSPILRDNIIVNTWNDGTGAGTAFNVIVSDNLKPLASQVKKGAIKKNINQDILKDLFNSKISKIFKNIQQGVKINTSLNRIKEITNQISQSFNINLIALKLKKIRVNISQIFDINILTSKTSKFFKIIISPFKIFLDIIKKFFGFRNVNQISSLTLSSVSTSISGALPPPILNISFVPPTLVNGTLTTNTTIPINVSIISSNLSTVIFNWNNTNYTIFDDSLVLWLPLDYNLDFGGDNSTKTTDLSKYGNNGTTTESFFRVYTDDFQSYNVGYNQTQPTWVPQYASRVNITQEGTIKYLFIDSYTEFGGDRDVHVTFNDSKIIPLDTEELIVSVDYNVTFWNTTASGFSPIGAAIYLHFYDPSNFISGEWKVNRSDGNGRAQLAAFKRINGKSYTLCSVACPFFDYTINTTFNAKISMKKINSTTFNITFYINDIVNVSSLNLTIDEIKNGQILLENVATQTKFKNFNVTINKYIKAKYDKGYNFDGIGDTIVINDSNTLDNPNFTILFWVKGNTNNTDIIRKWESTNEQRSWSFDTGSFGDRKNISFRVSNGTNTITATSNIITIDDNWNFVAGTFNTSTAILYQNGRIVGSEIYSFGTPFLFNSSSNIKLGDSFLSSNDFNGTLDNLLIFNKSLNDSEIYQLYITSLTKYNQTNWNLHINQSKNSTAGLDKGTYTYYAFASNIDGIGNSTDTRTVTIIEQFNILITQLFDFNVILNRLSKFKILIFQPFNIDDALNKKSLFLRNQAESINIDYSPVRKGSLSKELNQNVLSIITVDKTKAIYKLITQPLEILKDSAKNSRFFRFISQPIQVILNTLVSSVSVVQSFIITIFQSFNPNIIPQRIVEFSRNVEEGLTENIILSKIKGIDITIIQQESIEDLSLKNKGQVRTVQEKIKEVDNVNRKGIFARIISEIGDIIARVSAIFKGKEPGPSISISLNPNQKNTVPHIILGKRMKFP